MLARGGAGYEKHGLRYQAYVNGPACRVCALRGQCTKDVRRIERWEKEALMERVAGRVAAHPEIIRRRKALVEHPFGTIKFWWHQGALLTRGRRLVQAELSLSALAYNLRRALAVLGLKGLIGALKELRAKVREACQSAPLPDSGACGSRFVLLRLALVWLLTTIFWPEATSRRVFSTA